MRHSVRNDDGDGVGTPRRVFPAVVRDDNGIGTAGVPYQPNLTVDCAHTLDARLSNRPGSGILMRPMNREIEAKLGSPLLLRTVVLAVVGTSVLSLVIAFVYHTAKISLRNEVRQYLASTAQAVALNIDAEKLQRLRSVRDESRPEFVEVRRQLQRLMHANREIRYCYTMRKGRRPDEFLFVVDASETKDENHNGRIDPEERGAHIGEPYDVSAFPEMRKAFTAPTADREPGTDEWGTVLSGYSPIHDRNGHAVAILGVDMAVTTLTRKERALKVAAWIAFASVAALMTLVSLLYAQRTAMAEHNLQLLALTERRNRTLAALNNVAALLSLSGDLLPKLQQVLNQVRENLQAEGAGILRLQAGQGTLRSVLLIGDDAASLDGMKAISLREGHGDFLRLLRQSPVVRFELHRRTEPWGSALLHAGFRQILFAALKARDQMTGVIFVVFRDAPLSTDPHGEDFLAAVGHQVAVAMENEKLEAQTLQAEKMAALGELVAGVAHEINNPVSFIQSNMPHLREYVGDLQELIASIEQSEGLTRRDREVLEGVKREMDYEFLQGDLDKVLDSFDDGTHRIAAIVRELQTFAHQDHGRWQEFDIRQPIETALNLLAHRFRDKVTVHKEYGDVPLIEGYQSQLGQVFVNILGNVEHAVGESGNVWIGTWVEKNDVVVSVRDDGGGIAAEHLDRIFDPFFTTKPVGEGTGLGMSISYAIVVDRHNGEILVESEPGAGTTFQVRLPMERG